MSLDTSSQNIYLTPSKFRFRKVVRIMGLVCLFISKICKHCSYKLLFAQPSETNPNIFQNKADRYILTTGRNQVGSMKCSPGLVICLPNSMIMNALQYYYRKASNEVKQFFKKVYEKISVGRDGILYYIYKILPCQEKWSS